MDDGVQQQALGIYEEVALLTLDRLAHIVPVRLDRAPPFSVLFTFRLSMIAAVGAAARPS